MNRGHRIGTADGSGARPTFLERRVPELITEARQQVAEGDLGPASRRLRSTCQFILQTFGDSHPELPDLYQILSDVLDSLGALPDAEEFQTISMELRRLREEKTRQLWKESGLSHLLGRPTITGDRPDKLNQLLHRIAICIGPPRFPEITICGSEASGRAGILREIGRLAIDRLWRVRLLEYDDLPSNPDGRTIRNLDDVSLLLIDSIDPSFGGDRDQERWLHRLLEHRRGESSTILAVLPEFLSSAQGGGSCVEHRSSWVEEGGVWIDLESRKR